MKSVHRPIVVDNKMDALKRVVSQNCWTLLV